jgi:hypothetical protein
VTETICIKVLRPKRVAAFVVDDDDAKTETHQAAQIEQKIPI